MKDIDFLKKGIFAYQGIYDNKNVYENTLEAFKVAIKRRNNIYFEVIETKDHKFVVCKNDVFERISDLEFLIGMRFHANVVAIKSGVKALAINYDIKVKKLAEEYNLPLVELKQKDFSKEFDALIG